MKKILVLLVLVVAMVATPVFAEVTQGAYAGDFTYKIGGNFKDAAVDNVYNDFDLALTAMVGEFTTFSVGLSGGETNQTSAAGAINMVPTFNSIEMTQDFSAMVGNDITLKMTVGNFNHEITEYETIGKMDQTNSTQANNVKVSVAMAGITVNAIVAPTSLFNDTYKNMAVEAVYTSDMVMANVAYVSSGLVEKGIVEGGLKVVVADLTVTGMAEANLATEINKVYAGVQYAMAPITAKAAFYAPDMKTVADTANAYVGVDYAATDMVTVKAGATVPFKETATMLGFDGAVCMKVDTVEYKLGAAYQTSSYAAAYAGTTTDPKFMVSFQMDIDF